MNSLCHELLIAIEIDGSTHHKKIEEDETSQKKLETLGIRFLRFQDRDVSFNLNNVIITIKRWIRSIPPLLIMIEV